MSKILSQEEIDALLKNVGQDNAKTDFQVVDGNEKRVTLYDFSHPHFSCSRADVEFSGYAQSAPFNGTKCNNIIFRKKIWINSI